MKGYIVEFSLVVYCKDSEKGIKEKACDILLCVKTSIALQSLITNITKIRQ